MVLSLSLRRPLTPSSDVELTCVDPEPAFHADRPRIEVVRARWKEYVIGSTLFVVLVVPSVTVLSVVAGQWQSSTSQRGWLILGFGFYIVAALKALWEVFVRVCEQILFLRVELRKMTSPMLFEGVSASLAAAAEKNGHTCSWDHEVIQEHDKVTGDITVKLRFWSSRPRGMTVHLDGCGRFAEHGRQSLAVHVQFSPGEDVVCGRDSRVERRDTLTMSVRSTPGRVLADKAVLSQWFEESYQSQVKPVDGVVNVYALQESSTDWVPTWSFERVKPCKSAKGTGHDFFLERTSLQKVLADAKLWSRSALRVYLIAGPPGVGKSEFTLWLAGQMRLPVYRLCLSSPRLTDDRLSQLLSQSAVSHNSILVQVDEFQETVQRWIQSPGGSGVSPGGFCECLQGSTAMSRGVVVLTGTSEIVNEAVKRQLPAVFRRVHREAHLSWMGAQDIRYFFRQFLLRFVPANTLRDWAHCEDLFMDESGPWGGTRHISVDMLKQYLMHQITEASCMGLGVDKESLVGIGAGFQVLPERLAQFFNLVCDWKKAGLFLDSYAPVTQ